jgi:hypothetical protein
MAVEGQFEKKGRGVNTWQTRCLVFTPATCLLESFTGPDKRTKVASASVTGVAEIDDRGFFKRSNRLDIEVVQHRDADGVAGAAWHSGLPPVDGEDLISISTSTYELKQEWARMIALAVQDRSGGAAVSLQSNFRGFKARRETTQQAQEAHGAATALQSRFRGFGHRKATAAAQESHSAAASLQSRFRGFHARKKMSAGRDGEDDDGGGDGTDSEGASSSFYGVNAVSGKARRRKAALSGTAQWSESEFRREFGYCWDVVIAIRKPKTEEEGAEDAPRTDQVLKRRAYGVPPGTDAAAMPTLTKQQVYAQEVEFTVRRLRRGGLEPCCFLSVEGGLLFVKVLRS